MRQPAMIDPGMSKHSELAREWATGLPPRVEARAAGWLRALGSLRFALVVLVLLLGGVVLAYATPGNTTWPMAIPLGLFTLNLSAAVVVQPAFRRQPPLLVFHLALLAIVALAAVGRLTYFKGHLELSAGERFTGRMAAGVDAGPLHPWGIKDVRFVNHGFTIDYLRGRQRDHTRNRVGFTDGDGRERQVVIGDQVPLVVAGYRIYTSFNKGFALTFLWRPRQGTPQRGTVHLPAFPIHEYRQANTWTPPGAASELWIQLRFDEPLLDPRSPAKFSAPESHLVVVRAGLRRVELAPGGTMDFPDGRLVYEGVRTWMGYKVFYDPTLPWIFAACLVAVASLSWHFWRKYASRPWWVESLERTP